MTIEMSVIVPVYNGEDTIRECIEALKDQSIPETSYEIIVVDDGSTDRTAELVENRDVRLLRQERSGPAAARNAGVQRAQAELIVFTDADCFATHTFLECIRAAFDDPTVMGCKGAYRTNQAGLVPRFVQQEYQHKYDRMARYETIDFIDTYAAAYRRRSFMQEGGFDERFLVPSVEDQEFSFRLARQGYKLKFVPEAIVHHRHDTNLGEYSRRKFRIGYWKMLLLRWHPERVAADSHTPLPQRLQVGIMGLALPLILLALYARNVWWAVAALLTVTLLSAVPEFIAIVRRDAPVLLIAPVMLLVRAGALLVGLLAGVGQRGKAQTGHQQPALNLWQRLVKRAMDIAISALALLLTLPLLSLAALAIKLQDGGAVFFRQERVGEGGKRFSMLKLRSMVPDAEARLSEVMGRSPHEGAAFKILDDPRVTPVGRVLRRWSLDELPQLWNVLRGDLSLVGPRPEQVFVVDQYDERQRSRLSVPQGLTGPMQVSGRGMLDIEARLELELNYIENYSLWRDILIILRTIPAVIRKEGAL